MPTQTDQLNNYCRELGPELLGARGRAFLFKGFVSCNFKLVNSFSILLFYIAISISLTSFTTLLFSDIR